VPAATPGLLQWLLICPGGCKLALTGVEASGQSWFVQFGCPAKVNCQMILNCAHVGGEAGDHCSCKQLRGCGVRAWAATW